MTTEKDLNALKELADRRPIIKEFYEGIADIYNYQPDSFKDLDWGWIMSEANRQVRDAK